MESVEAFDIESDEPRLGSIQGLPSGTEESQPVSSISFLHYSESE